MAVSAAVAVASFSGVDLAAAAAEKVQSVADLLAQRSPGERTGTQLTKTKHKYSAVLAEREAPAAAPTLPSPVAQMLLPATPAPLIPETLPVLAEAVPPLPPIFLPIIGGGVLFPGGGGGGPGGGGGAPEPPPPLQPPPTQPPPIVAPPVPEPATWTMMIVGFGVAGWQLRRRRAAERPSVVR